MAFRLSPHPIGITELETGRCLEINDACLEIFGFRREEVIGRTTLMLGIWPDPEERVRLIERVKAERSVRNTEVTMRMKDGDLRRFLISTGLIKLGKKRCLLTIGNDITERKQTEQAMRHLNKTLEHRVAERTVALRESEERFRAFLDHAPNLAFIKALDGRYLYTNRRFQEAFGLDQKNLVGKTDTELFPRDQADQFQSNDHQVLDSGQSLEFEEIALYTNGPHTNLVVKFPMRDESGCIYATGGIVTDITERKQVEEELLRNQETLRQQRVQLEDLTSKLITAQEQERQRVARELHDDLSQRMAAVVLDIATIEQQPPLLPERLTDILCPIRERLEQLSDDIHNLAYKLHPSLLEHAGLQPAVEDHVREFTKRTGLPVSLKAQNVPASLSLDHSTGLFRVLQESLQNVGKHAKATQVSVKLSGSSKGVGLSVTDNGTGFDAQDTSARRKGLGLINMQERLRLLGGFLRIHAQPGAGTKVCAWIPLKGTSS
ncbi:MAG: PAS domain S-box protein [Nitrospira sp.]|nr:PAS domain S-box protein [Nitrospira sp.]